MEDTGEPHQRSRGMGRLLWVIALLVVGSFVISGLIGHVMTDRLTVHNRTTVAVRFTTDAFGSYPNYVGACSSNEFRWELDGSRSGWTPADGGRWQGGAVEIDIPVERWFEVQVPADRFAVLVTKDGVLEIEPESSLPACDGVPPPE